MGLFKNQRWEERYFASYAAVLEQWPISFEERRIETSFGVTNVMVSGPEDAYPLVLLHGGGSTSTIWFPNIKSLSQSFRTYTIDIIGDFGKSPTENPPESRQQSADWLCQVLDGLGLQEVHLAGISYGAYLSTHFTIHHPGKVQKLVLLSPAATLQPLSLKFALFTLGTLLFPFRPRWLCRALIQQNNVTKVHDLLLEQAIIGIKGVRLAPTALHKVPPVVIEDEEWKMLKIPILLLMGDKEWTCQKPKQALERFRRLAVFGEAEMLENAGHVLNADHPKWVNQRIVDFLA